jgi:glycosyltransferase involved in cell wall biosynthesis
MKISILLPFKNAAPWLEETISSIVDQGYTDWELICIDDHSVDDSNIAILQYCNIDSRIRLIQNSGKGIISALQLGLNSSTGDFITRMDADDIMPEGRLQLMHDELVSSLEKTVVTGKVKYFAEGQLSEGFLNYELWVNERIDQLDHYDHIYRECVVASPNWMVRKQDLLDAEIFSKLIYPEDYDLVFHWYQNDFKIRSIPQVTLLWRDHPTRTSKNSDVYNQQALFKLKIDWFNKLRNKELSIAVLGAGTKGKLTTELLQFHNVLFGWYDLNHENFNAPVLGKSINDYNLIHEDLLLISIYPKQKDQLIKFIESKGYSIGSNAWFL